MLSPRPMPSGRVVKNGVKSLSATSWGMPDPRSVTANSIQPLCWFDAARRTRMSRMRVGRAGSSMACMALRARLSSTCSTMVRSHNTGGRWGSSEVFTRTPSLRACRLTSGRMASSNCCAYTASRAWSRRRTKSWTLLITLPARSACRAICCMAMRTSCSCSAWAAAPAPCSAGVGASSRLMEPVA
ncbi:hypothetical protein D3C71_1585540 [compost metagenome]